ncbi:MAG TPA: AMP-binding protein, partial [Polyangiaceae bacterium]
GRPKGVEITRGAFGNFLSSMAHTPGLADTDRILAITTTSFDIAGLELFLPLWVGATVVIADRETARDPRLLRRRLESDRITMLQATPATWRLLLEAGWSGDGKLRMLCGGEALSPTLADRLLAAGGELWNVYGPTETTVWSSLEKIQPGYDRITIGKPIDETQMYILDESMNPVAAEQEGEIWIGGAGLARGYQSRPELTAERFVQNPHGPPGDRIYRTGDLGRQRTDGRFECLGRLDHQVKIRGYRIELGEIETVFRGVPGVLESLVVADQREDRDPRLVAYWVGAAERDALIEAATARLPPYMVPSAYVPLQAFPINTNGKIDRKRLPQPEATVDPKSTRLKPRTDNEARIAATWCDVLGLSQVPVDRSFFTLGGTSVLAVQLLSRMEQELSIDLSLQAFFEEPTVAGMAARIGKQFSPDDPIVVWLRRGQTSAAPLFCLFGVNLYQDLALSLEGDRRVLGAHVPFRYVPGRDPRPRLEAIAQKYLAIIRRYQERGPYHLLGLCFGGIVAYEVGRLLEAA